MTSPSTIYQRYESRCPRTSWSESLHKNVDPQLWVMVLGHPRVAQITRALFSTRQHAKSFEGITVSAKKHWECLGVLGNITEHQALLGNTWQGWKVSGSLTRSLGTVLATLVPKKQTNTHTHICQCPPCWERGKALSSMVTCPGSCWETCQHIMVALGERALTLAPW
jgi:hypothetical protein